MIEAHRYLNEAYCFRVLKIKYTYSVECATGIIKHRIIEILSWKIMKL